MGFRTDEAMRRFVNDKRELFLNSLPTDLFMEEFPGLHSSTRQKIKCRLTQDGPWSANSLLIDSILRLENLTQKFIRFCNEKGQCIELAKLLERKLLEINGKPRERQNDLGNSDSKETSGACRDRLDRRGERRHKRRPHETSSSKFDNTENQSGEQGMRDLPVVQGACADVSSTSSFYLESSDLSDLQQEEQHAFHLKEVQFRSEAGLENINIPPSTSDNIRARRPVPSDFSGTQCQEDVERFKLDARRSFSSPSLDETFRKSVYVSDDKDKRPVGEHNIQKSKKKEVKYFEISPLDVLGMPKDAGKTEKGCSSLVKIHQRTQSANNISSAQGGADDDGDKILNTSSEYSHGFSLQANTAYPVEEETAQISTPTFIYSTDENLLRNEALLSSTGESESENESGDEISIGEDSPDENPDLNPEGRTILSMPIRAVGMVVGGVAAILRATVNYFNRLRDDRN